MGKAPAFQFYIRDWLSDPELQSVSASSRGIWINALCYMWESKDRGRLTGEQKPLRRLLNCSQEELVTFLKEAEKYKFCDVVTDGNGNVTLISRRMEREERVRKLTRSRVRRHRNGKEKRNGNENETPPSSSSTSCTKVHSIAQSDEKPSSEPEEKVFIALTLNDKSEHPILQSQVEEFQALYPKVDVEQELRAMRGWCINNPQKRKTKSGIMKFVNGWLAKEQDSGKPGKSREPPNRSTVPDYI